MELHLITVLFICIPASVYLIKDFNTGIFRRRKTKQITEASSSIGIRSEMFRTVLVEEFIGLAVTETSE